MRNIHEVSWKKRNDDDRYFHVNATFPPAWSRKWTASFHQVRQICVQVRQICVAGRERLLLPT